MISGDIVVEINGTKVNTSEEIYQAVRSSDQITMRVQRGDELLRLCVTPEYAEWERRLNLAGLHHLRAVTVVQLKCLCNLIKMKWAESERGCWTLKLSTEKSTSETAAVSTLRLLQKHASTKTHLWHKNSLLTVSGWTSASITSAWHK